MALRIVCFAVLVLLWLAFAGSVSPAELGCAVGGAVLAGGWRIAVRRRADVPGASAARWVAQAAWAWPRRILADTVRVLVAAVRAGPRAELGHFLRAEVPGGAPDAKLAWSIIGTSISPNAYVVGWDEDARTFVLHELVPTGRDAGDLLWWPR